MKWYLCKKNIYVVFPAVHQKTGKFGIESIYFYHYLLSKIDKKIADHFIKKMIRYFCLNL